MVRIADRSTDGVSVFEAWGGAPAESAEPSSGG